MKREHLIGQMVTFARVVEAGSFAAAARALDVNTSVTSKHVTQLERELGTRLLDRGTRSLKLTEAGAVYLRHCQRVIEEVEHARQTVKEMQSTPRGRLRVSAPPGLIAGLVVPWLPEFRRRFPLIELDVSASNRFVDLAEEDDLRPRDALHQVSPGRDPTGVALEHCQGARRGRLEG